MLNADGLDEAPLPCQWVGVDCYLGDFHPLLRSRLLVNRQFLQLIQNLPAFQDLAKDRVLPIQMRRSSQRDKKLAAVGGRPLVSHAHDASRIVPERGPDLVLEEVVGRVVDRRGRLGFWVGGGAAGLQDEVGNYAMERAAVVEVGGTKSEEVFGRLGDRLTEDLELDVAARGV